MHGCISAFVGVYMETTLANATIPTPHLPCWMHTPNTCEVCTHTADGHTVSPYTREDTQVYSGECANTGHSSD